MNNKITTKEVFEAMGGFLILLVVFVMWHNPQVYKSVLLSTFGNSTQAEDVASEQSTAAPAQDSDAALEARARKYAQTVGQAKTDEVYEEAKAQVAADNAAQAAQAATGTSVTQEKGPSSSVYEEWNRLLDKATATADDTFNGGDAEDFIPTLSDGTSSSSVPVRLVSDSGQHITFILYDPSDASYLTEHTCSDVANCQQTVNVWVHADINYDKTGMILCQEGFPVCTIFPNAYKVNSKVNQQLALSRFLQWSNSPITDSAGNVQ